ncbi:LOW QUALITY PROTEIN: 26S proteasome non-ATPase regulatory subunit 8 homolog A [Capsella rubella]|uniref:LOW QUALITY PROTEIN: 26S proteasome non-ATPase regulatory subunit 8 homolog A n=1 Tax=Capsella rubella TaxID=81985 RepID=UPI000CD4DA19|nr:LOW QUALITY PROTEIN: 26S proteasome non-ATPase regulatory subunit 8 homolog A [Capsella rubella]
MDPQLTEVSQQFERFKTAFVRKYFELCTNCLSQLKGIFIEYAVVLRVKTEDQDAFERDFFQLKPYYVDARSCLPPSQQENLILGLNLLRLLVQNRIAKFHTELEFFSSATLENPASTMLWSVELEQSFMEGAYNCMLSARQTAPDDTCVYFMDLLAKTIRYEIAGCRENAYDHLSISEGRKMLLLFSFDQELLTYVNEEHPEWAVKDGIVVFQKAKETAPCKEIPSLQLINQTLNYARDLELIV